jgi:hypothetical protein
MRGRIVLFAVVALVGSSAYAVEDSDKSKVIEKPVVADTPETFAQQAAWIETEMQPEGRYEFTKPADKQRVNVLLGQMSNLMQRSGSVASMDHDTRVQLFNDQEEVNGLLKHNDANRLVCESHQPIGSHIPTTTCVTYRQREATARNTKIGLGQFDLSRVCNGPGGNDANGCAPGSHQKSTGGH